MQLRLESEVDFEGWRTQARWLAAQSIPAANVHWRIAGEKSLLDDAADDSADASNFPPPHPGEVWLRNELRVPREFVELARKVFLHRSRDRFAALYRVLLRLKDEPRLLQIDVDPDVMRLRVFERQVLHDEHRMHAYVRFRKVDDGDGAQLCCVVRTGTSHRRSDRRVFRTPICRPTLGDFDAGPISRSGTARNLRSLMAVPRSEAPSDDALEDLWRYVLRVDF